MTRIKSSIVAGACHASLCGHEDPSSAFVHIKIAARTRDDDLGCHMLERHLVAAMLPPGDLLVRTPLILPQPKSSRVREMGEDQRGKVAEGNGWEHPGAAHEGVDGVFVGGNKSGKG